MMFTRIFWEKVKSGNNKPDAYRENWRKLGQA